MNSENCWEPLRAEALQRSEQSQARKVEKPSDWEISSRADAKAPEGSTTRASVLTLIRELYESGCTTRQVAAKLGIAARTAARWLHESGAELRSPGQTAKTEKLANAQWLREQYESMDRSAEWLARHLGVSPKTVIRNLRKHGIQVRSSNKGRKFDPEMHRKHSEWMKGRYCGELNPNWRGGAIDSTKRERTSYQSKMWSLQVRERDGKCVKCGSGEKLHAHHIKSWRRHPELRFDIANGETLCAICHEAIHKFQFPEWVTKKAPRVRSSPQG